MSEFARVEDAGAAGMDEGSRLASEFGLTSGQMRPLLEGARARGIADAFELLGAGAILLDETGAALHLSTQARAALGAELRLVGGHLVAVDDGCNHIVERIIASVLAGSPCEGVLSVGPDDSFGLHMRALPIAGARGDDAQLLKAVLVVSRVEPQGFFDRPAAAEQACVA
jgi:hypothetical protein